jgi:hypothetical protein
MDDEIEVVDQDPLAALVALDECRLGAARADGVDDRVGNGLNLPPVPPVQMTKKSVNALAFVRSSTRMSSAFLSSAAAMAAVSSDEILRGAVRLRVRVDDGFMLAFRGIAGVQTMLGNVRVNGRRYQVRDRVARGDALPDVGRRHGRGRCVDEQNRGLMRDLRRHRDHARRQFGQLAAERAGRLIGP